MCKWGRVHYGLGLRPWDDDRHLDVLYAPHSFDSCQNACCEKSTCDAFWLLESTCILAHCRSPKSCQAYLVESSISLLQFVRKRGTDPFIEWLNNSKEETYFKKRKRRSPYEARSLRIKRETDSTQHPAGEMGSVSSAGAPSEPVAPQLQTPVPGDTGAALESSSKISMKDESNSSGVTRKESEAQTYSCCMCLCHAATQTSVEKADMASQTALEDKNASGSCDAFSQWPEYELNVFGEFEKVVKDHTYTTTFIPPSPPPCAAPIFESTPVRGTPRQCLELFEPMDCESVNIEKVPNDNVQTDDIAVQIDESVQEIVETAEDKEDSDPDFLEYSRPADDSWVDGNVSDLDQMVCEKKYLVFFNQLIELFDMMACRHIMKDNSICGRPLVNLEIGESGSNVTIRARCFENHPPFKWSAQPMVGKMRAGNLLLCSAILFSGLTFANASKFAGFLGMEFVASSTYYSNQKLYLYPAIYDAWSHQQMELEVELGSEPIAIAGDGQCDSPGYSAKYCVYTVMEQTTRKILCIVVVQVTECTSSTAMEKLALQKALAELEQRGFTVKMLTTDRHISIAKMMRDLYKHIEHQYDLWHFGKSVKKKVVEASKKKGCKELAGWLKSISNHLWWCSRTCNKSLCLLTEKWNSILLHTTNKHMWLGYEVFHQCEHEPICTDEGRKKKWLTPESPAHDALVKIVCDKTIKKDLRGITQFTHTGPLEVFHSNVLTVRQKLKHFSLDGMLSRTQFVALLHNCNTGRKQARIKVSEDADPKSGALRYKVECPKSRKDWIAKKIFEGYDYGIVYDLMVHALQIKQSGMQTAWQSRADQVPRNIAPIPKPVKSDVVSRMTTRF